MNNVSSSQASPYGGTQQQHINTTQPQFMQQPQVHQPQQQSQAVQGGQNLPINPLQLVLPDGWIELYDANTNKWYYANQGMGLTQWEPPAGAVSKQMTSPVPQPAQQVSPMPTQPQYGSQPTMPMMQPQQASQPNFNQMYAETTNPLQNANSPVEMMMEPMAANEAMGGSLFGGSSF